MSNNLPRMNYGGIKQKLTATTPSNDVKNVSSHVGLSFVMASKGTEKVLTLNADEVLATYGIDLFDVGAKHYTHQSKYLSRMVAHGSKVVTKRITLPDAEVATLCLAAEITVRDNPVYVRNSDGSLRYDANGVVLTDGTSPGVFISWRAIPYSGFGLAAITQGRSGETLGLDGTPLAYLTNGEGGGFQTTSIVPILDLELSWKGGRGNAYSVGLTSLNDNNDAGLSTFRHFFLTLQENNQPLTLPTGDLSALFSFDPNHQDTEGNAVDITTVIAKQFKDIGRVHVYSTNLNTIRSTVLNGQMDLFDGEITQSNADVIYPEGDVRNGSMLNLLSGTTVKGIPYYRLYVDKGNFGGIDMDGFATIPFANGTDGYPTTDEGTWDRLETIKQYDLAVRAELIEMATKGNKYGNAARFPFRVFWDSGYSMATKFAALAIKNSRPEVNVITTPFSVVDVVSSLPDPGPVDPGDGPCVPTTLSVGNNPGFAAAMLAQSSPSMGIRYQVNGGPIKQTWIAWNYGPVPDSYARIVFAYSLVGLLPSENGSSVQSTPINDMFQQTVNPVTIYDFVMDIDNPNDFTTPISLRGLAAADGVAHATDITFLPSPAATVGADYGFNIDLFPFVFGSAQSITMHSCGRVQPTVGPTPITCTGAVGEAVFQIGGGGQYDFIVNGTALYSNLTLAQLIANLQMNNNNTFETVCLAISGAQPPYDAPAPGSSALLVALYASGYVITNGSIRDSWTYALLIRNAAGTNQRIRIVQRTSGNASGVRVSELTLNAIVPFNNSTVGLDVSDPAHPSVYFCLAAINLFSCAGATPGSGDFTIEGNYDVYLDGIRIGAHVPDTDVPALLNSTQELIVDSAALNGIDSLCISPDYAFTSDQSQPDLYYDPNTDTSAATKVWWKVSVDGVVIGIAVGGDISPADAALDQVATYGARLSQYVEDIPEDNGLTDIAGGFGNNGSWLQNLTNAPMTVRIQPLFTSPVVPMTDTDRDPVVDVLALAVTNGYYDALLSPYNNDPHN